MSRWKINSLLKASLSKSQKIEPTTCSTQRIPTFQNYSQAIPDLRNHTNPKALLQIKNMTSSPEKSSDEITSTSLLTFFIFLSPLRRRRLLLPVRGLFSLASNSEGIIFLLPIGLYSFSRIDLNLNLILLAGQSLFLIL